MLNATVIARAVTFYRSDETKSLEAVAKGVGVTLDELIAACRADARLADALDYREDVGAPNAMATETAADPSPAEMARARSPDEPESRGKAPTDPGLAPAKGEPLDQSPEGSSQGPKQV